MSTDEVNFYLIILALCFVLAAYFPVFKASREARRREQAAVLRR